MWDDPSYVADEYGIIFDNAPWYVKFVLVEAELCLHSISFHPPEREMKTVGGFVIPRGSKV